MIDIWAYACKTYAKPGVSDACLAAQDEGWDVPLLLFIGWYSHTHGYLNDTSLTRAMGFAEPYRRHCVEPIRRIRQFMKQIRLESDLRWEAQREAVKQWELDTEKFQLESLSQLTYTPDIAPYSEAIGHNLAMASHYFSELDVNYWSEALSIE